LADEADLRAAGWLLIRLPRKILSGSVAALGLVVIMSGANAESVLDDETADAIRAAIEKNWMIPIGLDHAERCTATLRLHLTPEGVVQQIDVLGDTTDAGCRTLAESARRAVLITQSEDGRLPLPPDKHIPTFVVRWPMKEICEQRGGC
jgi:hypothetical protein